MMRQSAVFFLLFTIPLCCIAKGGDTLELPKPQKAATAFKTEEIDIAGQKRFRIQTEHYDITAFRSEDGKLVGERLEHLFHVWELLAAEYLKEEAAKKPAQLRHKVILYRDKDEYVESLRRIEPQIARTNGSYHAEKKTVHFYASETGSETRVLFHEGTHQILAEHNFREKVPTFPNNFWLSEGIALFMQTLKIEEKSYTIGDILDDRLYSARVHQFERNYNMPIRKLTAMTAVQMHASTELDGIYSHSATLTHWLMFAEKGKYRSALFDLLRQTYLDTAKPESLSQLIGLSYDELDAKYGDFLKTVPE
jgi:hypothetical protein